MRMRDRRSPEQIQRAHSTNFPEAHRASGLSPRNTMKPSELKPGDYFRFEPAGSVFRLRDTDVDIGAANGPGRKATCVVDAGEGACRVGGHTIATIDVELVPMPHTKQFPYVVGRAYRTREGEKRICVRQCADGRWEFDGRLHNPLQGHGFFDNSGRSTCAPSLRELDIMGEWREEAAKAEPKPGEHAGVPGSEGVELIAGHTYRMRNGKTGALHRCQATDDEFATKRLGLGPQQTYTIEGGKFWYASGKRGIPGTFNRGDQPGDELVEDITTQDAKDLVAMAANTQPKEIPKETLVKRTLPTVTLDDIFNTLVKHDACWAKDGPIRLSQRLQRMSECLGKPAGISLRTLNDAVIECVINEGEASWILARMTGKLDPEAIKEKAHAAFGAELSKALDEWENPKPAAPPKPKLPDVTLTMSGEAAQVLRTVLDKIGGVPDAGHPRFHMEELAETLRQLGVQHASLVSGGSIYLNR